MTGLRERKRQQTHDTVSATAIAMFLERGYEQVSVADIAAAADISKPTLFRYFRSKEDLVLHRFADHAGEAARVVRARHPGQSALQALHAHVQKGLSSRDPVTGLNDHPAVLAFHDLVFSTPALSVRINDHVAGEVAQLAAALVQTHGDAHASGAGPAGGVLNPGGPGGMPAPAGPGGMPDPAGMPAPGWLGGMPAAAGLGGTPNPAGRSDRAGLAGTPDPAGMPDRAGLGGAPDPAGPDGTPDPAGLDDLSARLAAAQIIAVQNVLARENWRRLSEGETADDRYPYAASAAEHAFTLLANGLGGVI